MAAPEPKLDPAGVNALLDRAFEAMTAHGPRVTDVSPGRVTVLRPYVAGMLRPGGVISGPNLMALADVAAYALVLAHVGDQLMAVTSQLNMTFLRGAQPGDLVADGELLHLGRRSAVSDVRIFDAARSRLFAQANVTYALPLP